MDTTRNGIRISRALLLGVALLGLCSSTSVLTATNSVENVSDDSTESDAGRVVPVVTLLAGPVLPPEVRGTQVLRHDWHCVKCAPAKPSQEVVDLQFALAAVHDSHGHPLFTGKVNGHYTRELNRAVGAYQRGKHLKTRNGDVYNEEMYLSLRDHLMELYRRNLPVVTVPALAPTSPAHAIDTVESVSSGRVAFDVSEVSTPEAVVALATNAVVNINAIAPPAFVATLTQSDLDAMLKNFEQPSFEELEGDDDDDTSTPTPATTARDALDCVRRVGGKGMVCAVKPVHRSQSASSILTKLH